MLFLMNNAVLELDMRKLIPPTQANRFRALSLGYVLKLGREIFADAPLLHQTGLDQARRLAALVLCKAPQMNAALFQAPSAGCVPDDVTVRLADVDPQVIVNLQDRQRRAGLTPAAVDQHVWRQMAA